MKTIIKGILYFILGSILLGICFVCFMILLFGLKALPYANYIIAPGSQSFLGYSAWLLVFCTPILWVLAIIYYRFTQNGNTPSWVHRGGIIFFILGLINSALFSNQMSNEFRYQSVKSLSDTSITLPATDSLIIKAKEDDGWDNYNDFLSLQNDQVRVKICRLKVEPSLDKNYHYRLVANSRGPSPQQAEKNCNEIEYPISSEKNTLVIPQGIALKKGQVWRGQSVQLIISVPEGKYLSFSRNSIVQIPKISWLPNEVRFDYSEMLEDDDWYQMVNGKLINKTNQENDVIEEVTEEIERGNEELRELREERLQELHDAKDQFKNELTHMSDEMRKILGEEKIKKTIDSLDQAIQQIQSEIDSERDKITKELKRKIDEAVQKKKEIESRDTI